MKYALWTIQGILAALFVFAGGMKLITPAEVLQQQSPLPVLFVQFIGLAELLGGLGLVLPSLLRIKPQLTVLAASELAHIMVGATLLTLGTETPIFALIPAVVGCLAGFVAYARLQLAPTRRLDARPHAVYSAV